MKCVMCLEDTAHYLEIFDSMGIKLQISQIVAKHFWFEPKEIDGVSSIICQVCWKQIENFHNYYRAIEEAQGKGIKQEILENLSTDYVEQEVSFFHFFSTIDNGDEELKTYFELTDIKEEQNTNEIDSDGKVQSIKDEDHTSQSFQTASEENVYIDISNCDDLNNENPKKVKRVYKKRQKNKIKEELNSEDHTKLCKSFQTASEDDDYTDVNNCDDLNNENPKKVERVYKKRQKNKTKEKLNSEDHTKLCKSSQTASEDDDYTDVNNCDDLNNENPKKVKRVYKKRQKNKTKEKLNSARRDEIIGNFMKLKCELCAKECVKFAEIRRHFRKEHKEPAYVICCNIKYFRRVHLFEHVNKHLDPENCKCVVCDEVFVDKQSLRAHRYKIHAVGKKALLECKECSQTFDIPSSLERHKANHVPPEKRNFFCDECGKACASKYKLATHIKVVHSQSYRHMCDICAKVIKGKSAFHRHRLDTHNIRPKVECKVCGAWMKATSLSAHKRRHKLEPQICTICGKTLSSDIVLKYHMRSVHSSERPFKCHICPKDFNRNDALQIHIRTHTGERPYACRYCSSTWKSGTDLITHMKAKHRAEWEEHRRQRRYTPMLNTEDNNPTSSITRPVNKENITNAESNFPCDSCAKVFKDKYVLNRHKRNHHNIRPKIECKVCGVWVKRTSYPGHKQSHEAVPQICTICGKTLSSDIILKNHMRRVHSSERPFKCHICPKDFNRKDTLQNHIRTHTGERPYACRYCPSTWKTSSDLITHMKAKHRAEWEERRRQRLYSPMLNTEDNDATNPIKPAEPVEKENSNAESNSPGDFTNSI